MTLILHDSIMFYYKNASDFKCYVTTKRVFLYRPEKSNNTSCLGPSKQRHLCTEIRHFRKTLTAAHVISGVNMIGQYAMPAVVTCQQVVVSASELQRQCLPRREGRRSCNRTNDQCEGQSNLREKC